MLPPHNSCTIKYTNINIIILQTDNETLLLILTKYSTVNRAHYNIYTYYVHMPKCQNKWHIIYIYILYMYKCQKKWHSCIVRIYLHINAKMPK